MSKDLNRKIRLASYASIFFLTINNAFSSYLDSNFLSAIVGEHKIGLVYGGSALLSILALLTAPFLVRHLGVVKSSTTISAMIFAALIALIISDNPVVLVGAWVIFYALGFIVRYNMDLYLEHVTDNHRTGNIRGLFLTIINTGWLVSPLIAGLILNQTNSFKAVYLISALILLPFILFGLFSLRENHQIGNTVSVRSIFREFKSLFKTKKNAGLVLFTDLSLNFFYALMVVFMPIYLKNYIGLDWQQIGIAFTVALIPFVIIQLPLGRLADSILGEKELLIAGFLVMAVSTFAMAILTTNNILIWTVWLFISRLGAATVEVMKETALFKHISSDNTAILSLARSNIPLSALLGSGVASLFLAFSDYHYLFIFLAVIMLLSVLPVLKIKDSR